MKHTTLPVSRVRQILSAARKTRALVIGDVMLDHFIWGEVGRISPEAPVPVVDFKRENYIPGGAGNVARNLSALEVPTELFGVVGQDGDDDSFVEAVCDPDGAGQIGGGRRAES